MFRIGWSIVIISKVLPADGGKTFWTCDWVMLSWFLSKDPGISTTSAPGTYSPFDDGLKRDVFIKNATGHILIGEVRLHFFSGDVWFLSHCEVFMSRTIPYSESRFGRAQQSFPTSPTLRRDAGGRTASEIFILKFTWMVCGLWVFTRTEHMLFSCQSCH